MTNTDQHLYNESTVDEDMCSLQRTMNGLHQNCNVKQHYGDMEHTEHKMCDVQHQNGYVEHVDGFTTMNGNNLTQDCATHSSIYKESINSHVQNMQGNGEEPTSYISIAHSDRSRHVTTDTQPRGQITNGALVYDLCDRLSSVGMDDLNEDDLRQQNESISFNEEMGDEQSLFQWTHANVFSQDKDGDTCLHIAIILQELQLVMTLINTALAPRSLSTSNNLSQTPLYLAVLTNQITAVRRLMVGGAEIDSRDRKGNTPLHLACQQGNMDMAATLMEPVRYHETKLNTNYEIPYQKIPQNLETANYEGKTVLHLAAEHGHDDIVKFLIERRANVNARDGKSGRTILHSACLEGNIELVKYLMSVKACNINSKSFDEYTPFDFARFRGHTEITILLAKAGALKREDDEYSD